MVIVFASVLVQQSTGRYWLGRAEQAYETRRLEASDHAYQMASRWTFSKAPLTMQRARIARLLDRQESFESLLGEAQLQGASGTSIRLERQLQNIQLGEVSENRSKLTSLLADPVNAPATLEAFATGYLATGELRSAQEILESWLEIDPDAVVAHSVLGQIYFEQENFGQAEIEFRKAASVNPDLVDARLGLARTCYSLDKTNDAIKHFSAVLAIDPQHIESMLSRAALKLKKDGSVEAVGELESVIADHPDLYPPRYELASYLAKSNEHARVIELIEPLMDRFPDDIALNYLLGGALSESGNRSRAAPYLDRYLQGRRTLDRWAGADLEALAIESDDSTTKQIALDYARYQWDESSPWLLLAVEMRPRDAELHRVLSEIYEKNGSLGRSERHRKIASLIIQTGLSSPSERGGDSVPAESLK